jgi:hypothetical protein
MAITNTVEARVVGTFIDRLSGPADKAFKKISASAKRVELEKTFDTRRIAQALDRFEPGPETKRPLKDALGDPLDQGADMIDLLARGMENSLPTFQEAADRVGLGLERSISGAIRSLEGGFSGLENFATRTLDRIAGSFFDVLGSFASRSLAQFLIPTIASLSLPAFAHGGDPPLGRS